SARTVRRQSRQGTDELSDQQHYETGSRAASTEWRQDKMRKPQEEPMRKQAETDHDFWGRVLTVGGFTPLPRWTLTPVKGVAEHKATIPGDLVMALHRLADELALPLSSMLLAAHIKVLAALSGEREVMTGYIDTEGSQPLPYRLTTESGSWRTLLL